MSVTCSATKLDGTPCKMREIADNGRCCYHQGTRFARGESASVTTVTKKRTCGAVTRKGSPCVQRELLENGRCKYHQTGTPDEVEVTRCSGYTKGGRRCRQLDVLSNGRCRYHQPRQVSTPSAPVQASVETTSDASGELAKLREENARLKAALSALIGK